MIRLDDVIEKSTYLVGDLINFNKDQWPVRYPCLAPSQDNSRHACEFVQWTNWVVLTSQHLRDRAWHDARSLTPTSLETISM